MGGKGKAPKAPDLSALADASVEASKIWAQVQGDMLDWAKKQGEDGMRLTEQILGVQLPQMQEAFRQAQMDRQRYEETYLPIEQNLISEFESYDSPERREQEAATRMADTRANFEAQRENALQRLEGYGIDPSQTRSMALDRGVRAQEAAMSAMSANQGRQQVEQMGRALRGEAINIGRGLPSQVAQTQGTVNQTAGGAMGNWAQGVNAMGGAYNPALNAGGQQMAGLGRAASIQSQNFDNQMASWNANAMSNANMWSGLGSLAGAGMGMFSFGGPGGGEEGGAVPHELSAIPGPTDRHHVMLADNEYVVPADVVLKKGTEFFDKLLDKYKEGGEYEAKRQGIPEGMA